MMCSFFLLVVLVLPLTSFAESKQVSDPLEAVNRKIFTFNEIVDRLLLRPVARGYVYITPDFIEKGVNNFFDNFFYPTVIVNQLLQGKPKLALQDSARFLFNTTLGLGGLFDIAKTGGLEEHNEDFGQTLAVWGLGSGPYLVLPVWGPSSLRDGAGMAVDTFTNPLFYLEDDELRYALFGTALIDSRAEFLHMEDLVSGDGYLFMRDAYLQRRSFLVADEKVSETDPFLED